MHWVGNPSVVETKVEIHAGPCVVRLRHSEKKTVMLRHTDTFHKGLVTAGQINNDTPTFHVSQLLIRA